MPIRSLIYFSVILSDMLSDKKNKKMIGRNIYGKRLVKIPTPNFIVFIMVRRNSRKFRSLSFQMHLRSLQTIRI